MMRKIGLIALTAAFAFGQSAVAAECGEPPLAAPIIPNGEHSEADDIRAARTAVVDYSAEVDKYLACMDSKASLVFPYMTKEQKSRWDEDLADVHNKRRDAQTAMNEAIRAYRRVQQ